MVAIDFFISETGSADHTRSTRPAHRLLDRVEVTVLVVALTFLFVVRVLAMILVPFTDTTEARYAEIARIMVETGNWITPQFTYDVPFWGKPPLYTWLSASGMQLFGVGEFGARVFIFMTSLIVLWLVFTWVRERIGRDVALLSCAALAGSVLFFGSMAFVMTDIPMVLGTTLSMVSFFRAVTAAHRRAVWSLLFFLGLAIGLLAKGPVAVVLTGIPLFIWLLSGKRWWLLGRLNWISGLALLAIIVFPWYLAAEIRTLGFLRYFLVGEHLERFLVPGWMGDKYGSGHSRAPGMIWAYWMLSFMPWTILAGALFLHTGKIVTIFRSDREGWRSYLSLWAIAPLLLFTPAANILPAYTLPAMPASAILLVVLWIDVGNFLPRKRLKISFLTGLAVTAAGFLTVAVLAGLSPDVLRLKSQKELIQTALEFDPHGQLNYWGRRSFSADFYSSGSARMLHDKHSVETLIGNGRQDFIALKPEQLGNLLPLLQNHYRKIGSFGRYLLLAELPESGWPTAQLAEGRFSPRLPLKPHGMEDY